MTEPTTSEAPAANTPRLVFDANLTEDEIPAFLRKGKNKVDTQDEPEQRRSTIKAPVVPVAVAELVVIEGVAMPHENVEVTEENDETSNVVEAFDNDDDADARGGDGGSFDEMSVEELNRQEEQIRIAKERKLIAERKAVIEQIKHVVDTYKIPIEELVEALGGMKVKRKGVKAEQKYQDPKTGATWSGRGKEPTWIRGKKRDRFLIK